MNTTTSEARSRGARQAGMYLHELLRTTYHDRWAKAELALRGRADKVNQAATARVLAAYLWDNPRRPDDREVDPEQLKDLVSRALSGKLLARRTLQLFIDAFDMAARDVAALWRQYEGTELARAISGELPKFEGAHAPTPLYETILLEESHLLGQDGRPSRNRTVQHIRALSDGFAVHRYSFDTNEADVERVHGGTPSEPYQLRGSIWAVDLRLPRVLKTGDTASMEYVTRFHYSYDAAPNFRRVAHQRCENVALRVEFDPSRLPRQVWWAEWKDYRAPDDVVLYQEPVALDSENAVSHFLESVEHAVVGFMWEFDDPA